MYKESARKMMEGAHRQRSLDVYVGLGNAMQAPRSAHVGA